MDGVESACLFKEGDCVGALLGIEVRFLIVCVLGEGERREEGGYRGGEWLWGGW